MTRESLDEDDDVPFDEFHVTEIEGAVQKLLVSLLGHGQGAGSEGTRRERSGVNFDPHTYHFHYLIIARLALVLMTTQYKVQTWLSLNVTRIYWVMA